MMAFNGITAQLSKCPGGSESTKGTVALQALPGNRARFLKDKQQKATPPFTQRKELLI
jgi:hypothetical protein